MRGVRGAGRAVDEKYFDHQHLALADVIAVEAVLVAVGVGDVEIGRGQREKPAAEKQQGQE